MTPELLHYVGEALYGAHWQAILARVLKVSERSVRRWRSGEHRINAGVTREIAALCERHSNDLARIAGQLHNLAAEMAKQTEAEGEEVTSVYRPR